MSEQLLNVFKYCLLALIYLFFFRVLRAVWAELRPPAPAEVPAGPSSAPEPLRRARAPQAAERTRGGAAAPAAVHEGSQLRVLAPPEHQGRSYPLDDEITVGRAAGCQVTVDDTFVSQVHARVFRREGDYLVEDLGSTNGTYLNSRKVAGPVVMQRGDRLQVGNTVLELE